MTMTDEKAAHSEYEKCRKYVDHMLDVYFKDSRQYQILLESMRYSLLAGGKRIRAVICLKFCEAAGGCADDAAKAACAIEMLHAYSLIHDDLPCMDDDDMRRGQPSNHIKYGESTAVLAGDALQAAAFETLLDSRLPPGAVVEMAAMLAQAAGVCGICGGQFLDLDNEGKILGPGELKDIHTLKTASLLSASAAIGVVAAGGTRRQIEAAEKYAFSVGYAFQVRDDLLDCTSTTRELGKPVGSDSENSKSTYASIMSIDECEGIIREETEKAIYAITGEFKNTDFLVWLAQMLAFRKN